MWGEKSGQKAIRLLWLQIFSIDKESQFFLQQRDSTTCGHQSFQILHLAKEIVDMTWASMDESRRQTIDAFCGYLPIEPYRPYQQRDFFYDSTTWTRSSISDTIQWRQWSNEDSEASHYKTSWPDHCWATRRALFDTMMPGTSLEVHSKWTTIGKKANCHKPSNTNCSRLEATNDMIFFGGWLLPFSKGSDYQSTHWIFWENALFLNFPNSAWWNLVHLRSAERREWKVPIA